MLPILSWDQRFFDSITVPGGRKLVTLRDATRYITALRKAEHDADEWQTAMEALLLVAGQDGTDHVRADRNGAGAPPAEIETDSCIAPQARQSL